MRYRVVIAESAKLDLRESARWIAEQQSRESAAQWLREILKEIRTLELMPLRCPLALERYLFPHQIRELLFGRSKRAKYRILFKVEEDVVQVLYIRHSARDEFEIGTRP